MASGGVSFLSLAYLIEISVVLNLAYRELKFPELHNRLEDEISKILEKAHNEEITDDAEYPEYGRLKSLISPKGNACLWKNVNIREFFFQNIIKPRRSLLVVNWLILINVISLIVFTSYSTKSFLIDWQDFGRAIAALSFGSFCALVTIMIMCLRFPTVLILSLLFISGATLISVAYHCGMNFNHPNVWLMAFGALSIFTLTPLLFIKMSTLCEVHLFGDDGKSGLVYEQKNEMFARKKAKLEKMYNASKEFKS